MSLFEHLVSYWYVLILLPAYLLAIGIAIARWKRHPAVSLCTVLAFATFFALTLMLAIFGWRSQDRRTAEATSL